MSDPKNKIRSAACRRQRTDMVERQERESSLRIPCASLYTLLRDSRDISCVGELLKLTATRRLCVLWQKWTTLVSYSRSNQLHRPQALFQ
jgi:hypothetical protein